MSSESSRVLLDASATDLAFRVGQLFEKVALQRGIEAARQAGSAVVTQKHVQAGIDSKLLDEVVKRLRENPDGKAGAEKAGNRLNQCSWKAA